MTPIEKAMHAVREMYVESLPDTSHCTMVPSDQVVQIDEGWFALVRGKFFGPHTNRGYALAALAVEMRRALARDNAAVVRYQNGHR